MNQAAACVAVIVFAFSATHVCKARFESDCLAMEWRHVENTEEFFLREFVVPESGLYAYCPLKRVPALASRENDVLSLLWENLTGGQLHFYQFSDGLDPNGDAHVEAWCVAGYDMPVLPSRIWPHYASRPKGEVDIISCFAKLKHLKHL